MHEPTLIGPETHLGFRRHCSPANKLKTHGQKLMPNLATGAFAICVTWGFAGACYTAMCRRKHLLRPFVKRHSESYSDAERHRAIIDGAANDKLTRQTDGRKHGCHVLRHSSLLISRPRIIDRARPTWHRKGKLRGNRHSAAKVSEEVEQTQGTNIKDQGMYDPSRIN